MHDFATFIQILLENNIDNYLLDNIIDFNSLSTFKHIIKLIHFTTFLKRDY